MPGSDISVRITSIKGLCFSETDKKTDLEKKISAFRYLLNDGIVAVRVASLETLSTYDESATPLAQIIVGMLNVPSHNSSEDAINKSALTALACTLIEPEIVIPKIISLLPLLGDKATINALELIENYRTASELTEKDEETELCH